MLLQQSDDRIQVLRKIQMPFLTSDSPDRFCTLAINQCRDPLVKRGLGKAIKEIIELVRRVAKKAVDFGGNKFCENS